MKCCICQKLIEEKDPPILTHGAFGHPRCLCRDCETVLDTVIEGKTADEVRTALRTLSDLRIENDDYDVSTAAILTQITEDAVARADAMEAGTYVPDDTVSAAEESDDDQTPCGTDVSKEDTDEADEWQTAYDIPEDLRETEEDRELDRRDAEREAKQEKIDRIARIVFLTIFACCVAYIIYQLLA